MLSVPIAVFGVTWQVLVDAVGLGAVYALMAVGIGLVFGVLRLINFAYGQLIMAGAYALAFASQWDWSLWAAVPFCFAVVIALSLVMDRAVFRPLRTQSPAVMLVATFAVAFLLQSVALLAFGPLGKPASSLGYLNRPVTIGNVDIRKITIVAIVVAAVCLVAVVVLLERTRVGLHMRAASMDFRTARLLGVNANRVIGSAVLVSALLAAAVSVILTVQNPLVTPDFALRDTIVVLAGVVVGGHEPVAVGDPRWLRDRLRDRPARRGSADRPEPVSPVARLRARHPRAADQARRPVREERGAGGARMTPRSAIQLGGPVVLVVAAGLLGSVASTSTEVYFVNALVAVSIVVALYVFVGNSGVLSFGHISFVAVGAWSAGVLSVPVAEKPAIMPYLFPFLRDHTVGNLPSLAIAAAVGGAYALLVGLPLMRLSGLAAGIATFGVLEITHNLLRYYEKIGPGSNTFSSVPETTDLLQATLGAVLVIAVAFGYQSSRFGRLLRATREDTAAARAVGVSVYRQRLFAFTLSGALAGLAGGLYVHLLPLNTESLYLDLTFITLAMLVIGGMTSLWGAVVGALAVSGLDSVLAEAENGLDVGGLSIDLPAGTRIVIVGTLMALVLIIKPSGLTGGRELSLDRFQGRRRAPRGRESIMRICVVGCGAVGSLFAANLATLDDVEVWAFDLYQGHVDAIERNGLTLSGAGDVHARLRATSDPGRCRRATSGSSPPRRCTPRRRSRRPRTHSPTERLRP